ncbi:MAG TPA: hypothetical protein VFL07_08675, partial [Rudaea sp.]|nr:hypothetical protein [Rudaea sp.]
MILGMKRHRFRGFSLALAGAILLVAPAAFASPAAAGVWRCGLHHSRVAHQSTDAVVMYTRRHTAGYSKDTFVGCLKGSRQRTKLYDNRDFDVKYVRLAGHFVA